MIHPSAIIDKTAIIGKNVSIGPYCVIGKNVTLDDEVELVSHVCLEGKLYIGKRSKIFPFASIGQIPQDLKYEKEDSETIIGSDNTIREYVSIHKGTKNGGMKTVIGNHCLFMIGVHIAHDCLIGSHVVMANHATLAGHVKVGDHVVIGGLSAFLQYCRVGAHAMIGGMSAVEKDVIPYGLVMGERAVLQGINIVGLRRRGFSNAEINKINETYKKIFQTQSSMNDVLSDENLNTDSNISLLIEFLKQGKKICLPK